jgi:proton glutamate symport protein
MIERLGRLYTTLGALLAFVFGFAAGLGLHASGRPFTALLTTAETIGTIWTNAFRATVIPLVISGLIVVFAGSSAAHLLRRLSTMSLAIFFGLLGIGATFAILVGPPLIARVSVERAILAPTSTDAAGADAKASAAQNSSWVDTVISPNLVKSGADGAILPLLVFTIFFALALTRLQPERRQPLLALCQSVRDTLGVLIDWIFVAAPIGIFALAMTMTARVGLEFVGAVGEYVVLQAAVMLLMTLFLYPVAAVLGRVTLRRFAWALLPAQLVGISTRSSMAALPAMLDGAVQRLGLPAQVAGFTLPLAVSVLRVSQSVSPTVRLLFLAHLYGIALTSFEIVTFAVTVSVLSFGRPGLPVSGGLTSVPLMLALGFPIEGVLLFRTADTMSDVFMTLLNVTSDMAAATVLARYIELPVGLPQVSALAGEPS